MTEDIFEVASHLEQLPAGPVIRLRDHPDAPAGSPSIYRYDREGLIKALRAARDAAPQATAGGSQ